MLLHHCIVRVDIREECLTSIISNFSVDRKTAKKLFLRIFFKGCLSNWCKDFKLVYKKIDYVENLQKELDTVANKLKEVNEALYISAKNQKEKKGEKNIIGSFFALYLQEYETRIVGDVLYYIINNTKLTKLKNIKGDIGTYEFDGIKLISKNVALFGGIEKVISFLNNKTKELTGFNLNWTNKEIEDFYTFAGISNDNILLNCYDDDDVVDNDDSDEDVDKELKNAVDYITKITLRYQMGIAEEVYKRNSNFFVFNEGNWICWDISINKWVTSNEPLKRFIIYDFLPYLENLLEPYKNIKNKESRNYLLYQYGTIKLNLIRLEILINGKLNGVIAMCELVYKNDNLQFDLKEYLLGFNNGVYDINTDEFRPYSFDDYVTMSCGFDMEDLRINKNKRELNEIDIERFNEMNILLKQIFPNDDIRLYFLVILASGIYGRCIEHFFIFNGAGGNGKGFIDEFMLYCLGDYGYPCDVGLLLRPIQNTNAPNPELAGMDKKRFVVFKEPPARSKILNAVMKDITGGGYTKARNCHSNKTKVLLNNTTILETNDKPLLSEKPTEGDIRRIRDLLFGSKFTTDINEIDEEKFIFQADANLKTESWKNDHRVYLMNILFEYIQMLKEENYNLDAFMPESVKIRTNNYLMENFDIHRIFTNLYNKVENNEGDDIPFIKLSEVANVIRKSEDFYNLTKAKQREYNVKYIKEFFESNKQYRKYYKEIHHYNENNERKLCRNVLLGWVKNDKNNDEND